MNTFSVRTFSLMGILLVTIYWPVASFASWWLPNSSEGSEDLQNRPKIEPVVPTPEPPPPVVPARPTVQPHILKAKPYINPDLYRGVTQEMWNKDHYTDYVQQHYAAWLKGGVEHQVLKPSNNHMAHFAIEDDKAQEIDTFDIEGDGLINFRIDKEAYYREVSDPVDEILNMTNLASAENIIQDGDSVIIY